MKRRDNRELHLLVVEDNIGDFVLVEEFLLEEFEQIRLSHVTTFQKAKTQIESNTKYDLILLDLSLPDNNGEELIDDVMTINHSTPVVILTGYTDLAFSAKSLAKGVSDYLLKDELSPTLLYKSIIYSLERNTFSAKIKESEKNYRELFELSPEPMMLFDLDTYEFLNVNQAAIVNYGYSKKEFLSMTLLDIKPEDEVESTKDLIQETRQVKNITLHGERRHVKKNGETIFVEITDTTLEYKGRNVKIALARDVTEKRREEERLKLLESVITHSTEAVVILDAEPDKKEGRRILYVNQAFTSMTGYTSDEVTGKTLHFLNGPETDQDQLNKLRQSMSKWEICEVEFINYKKDGTSFWINTSMVPVAKGDGGYSHWVAIGRNITEQKTYEQELQASIQEKEVLLSEIHHRVKNNLAVISGMMQLQAFDEKNREVQLRLYDSIFRIQTMATIHELLYQSESFSQLMFSDIIEKLVIGVSDTLDGGKDIDLVIEKEEIELNINQAIPCSLIINEVITNIYKHAFTGRDRGSINVKILEKHGEIILKIADDGVGLPDNFNIDDSGSLGMHIIKILVRQLEGTSSFESDENGTEFNFVFKKVKKKGIGSAKMDTLH
ncbi:MAG: PAS domain S-box protein [Balneolaceae bacterium]|nr:PAS domain S-box protein [Balneolaceae bacterium]